MSAGGRCRLVNVRWTMPKSSAAKRPPLPNRSCDSINVNTGFSLLLCRSFSAQRLAMPNASAKLIAESSTKRKLEASDAATGGSTKVAKIHPFFTKTQDTDKTDTGPFRWLTPLGTAGSCLHGVNLRPASSSKVAAFDLDGTIIKSTFGTKAPAGRMATFEWWRPSVPAKLKELHDAGYAIILISNQGIKPAALATWKEKIPLIGRALGDVPFRIMAATQKDRYRKPMPAMWLELERIFREEGVAIDKSASFFVGDAAGRKYTKAKGDFSSTDRKWAENVELAFHTPEEYFLKLAPHKEYDMPGFRPSSLPTLPRVTPTSSPILPDPPRQEVVIFVGYPCLGKSTFYQQHFAPAEYMHINQDTLKTREKCVKVLQEALDDGKSCVIDNTNRNVSTRKLYLDVCKERKVPSRCFLFKGSYELAWHNNLYRALNRPPSLMEKEPGRSLLPAIAFAGFRNNYEEPTVGEGFSEIHHVNWVFEGSEEDKKYWSMWLQLDGK